MAHQERYNTRDLEYSAWHRRNSLRRFLGDEQAEALSMIDVDGVLFVEYDHTSKEPLALIETARDIGQSHKPATVTAALARRCTPTLPAFVVLYSLCDAANPADESCKDIDGFRVKRIWPKPERKFKKYSPGEWVDILMAVRAYSLEKIKQAERIPKKVRECRR